MQRIDSFAGGFTRLGKGVRRITQMVFIQGLKKILKSPKQDVLGS